MVIALAATLSVVAFSKDLSPELLQEIRLKTHNAAHTTSLTIDLLYQSGQPRYVITMIRDRKETARRTGSLSLEAYKTISMDVAKSLPKTSVTWEDMDLEGHKYDPDIPFVSVLAKKKTGTVEYCGHPEIDSLTDRLCRNLLSEPVIKTALGQIKAERPGATAAISSFLSGKWTSP